MSRSPLGINASVLLLSWCSIYGPGQLEIYIEAPYSKMESKYIIVSSNIFHKT